MQYPSLQQQQYMGLGDVSVVKVLDVQDEDQSADLQDLCECQEGMVVHL